MWRKISGLAVTTLVLLGTFLFSSTPAQAVVTKTVHVDCLAQQPGWVEGTVYLFPQEQLLVTFEDCDWQMYIDSNPNPGASSFSPTRGYGDGSITLSADGTYVISSNMSIGSPQGTWFNDGLSENYLYLEESGAVSPLAYIEVDVVGEDVTTVTGKTLLANMPLVFGVWINGMDLFNSDPDLAHCIQYFPSTPGDTYVYVSRNFTTNVSGDFYFRTISTNPVTSYTNYIVQPDGYMGITPLLNVNYLIYENFDPQNPGDGLLGCGGQSTSGGDYLSSGEILSNRYYEAEVTLSPGTYTVVAAHIFPTTAQDWNTPLFWTPLPGQKVNAQIWGPQQATPSSSPQVSASAAPTTPQAGSTSAPTLAQTGISMEYWWAPLLILAVGYALIFSARSKQGRTKSKQTGVDR